MPSLPSRRPALAVLAALTCALTAPSAASAEVRDVAIPTSDAGLHSIAASPDGSVWFSEQRRGKVGRVAPDGRVAEWTIPTDGEFGPEELTVGRDGRAWVLSDAHALVFVVDPAVADRPVSRLDLTGGQLGGRRGARIATAPDGSIWISDALGEGVVRIVGDQAFDTRGGAPDCRFDGELAPGPDGRMWCAFQGDALKRIEPDGVTTVNTPIPSGHQVHSLASAGGALWYGRYVTASFAAPAGIGRIGRLVPGAGVREWDLGSRVAPDSLAAAPDGSVWFVDVGSVKQLGRITVGGGPRLVKLGDRRPTELAVARDGALWFIDANANRLTRVTLDEVGGSPAPALPATLRTRGTRVPVRVRCPKGTVRCVGTLRLRTAGKVRRGGRGRAAVRTVTAPARYALAPGAAATVRLRLTGDGRALTRGARSVRVVAEATPKAGAAQRIRTARLR